MNDERDIHRDESRTISPRLGKELLLGRTVNVPYQGGRLEHHRATARRDCHEHFEVLATERRCASAERQTESTPCIKDRSAKRHEP